MLLQTLILNRLTCNRALTIIIKGTLCFKFKFLPLWILLVVFKVPFDVYEPKSLRILSSASAR